MYAREIDGQEFTFGVSGKLIRNVLVMYDRQTESYWSQLLGEAVAGEMIGTKLEFMPAWMMTWTEWKAKHPDTVALDKFGRQGRADIYDNYFASGTAGAVGETFQDDRLYVKEYIVGVELADTAVAYPYSVLNAEPVVNDTIGDTNIVVVWDVSTAASVVFNRVVDGQILTFVVLDSFDTMTDLETGSTWDTFNGVAIEGPLAGQSLERVKSTMAFWFGWKDWHPDTIVYGIDE